MQNMRLRSTSSCPYSAAVSPYLSKHSLSNRIKASACAMSVRFDARNGRV